MKNYIQPGDNLTIPAPADTDAGAGVAAGLLFGVAQHDAATGEPLTLVTRGVFELPKPNAQPWAIGDALYWTGSQVTTTSGTGNLFIGVAVAVASNPSATGLVRLNGAAPAAETA
ncbi:DUF2190 family protein [Oceanicella sp. SM1341]|uniref:DUF2190 family protein n=1 Tax=Oceanicella sp. SM1341 TaxID=1548889 RepID=UPI000E4FEB0F|nr:capsid cement protein [Oceanicella sp. SM1341]